jgi:calcineurin-like phosphoesterase family protein
MYHPERKKGLVLLHGHTHDRLKVRGNQIHVGVDAWDWGPALYDDVAELIWRLPGG